MEASRESMARMGASPRRRFYGGRNLDRAVTIDDLRAMTHRRLPRFVLEYLEGGAETESSLARDREAYGDWRFMPRQLVDVSQRTLATAVLGRHAPLSLLIAPTGLNGLFLRGADIALAQAAADAGVPFVQSTMSNERMEDVAQIPNLRHWWQLYVFGGDEVWQDLVRRADACGCEALVLTTNAQIFGNREWSTRTMASKTRPSLPTVVDAAMHPGWIASTVMHGMPKFSNVLDYVPKDRRGFFETAFWIREHQPTSMDWNTVARIRDRWRKPFLLKGVLTADDVRRALDAGVDGIVLGTHGGRQLDSCISGLDLLPQAASIVQGRIALHLSGGLRRGTDLLKAMALGADAVMAGRTMLYGVCAGGRAGVQRALDILAKEALDAMGLLGVSELGELRALRPQLLTRLDSLRE